MSGCKTKNILTGQFVGGKLGEIYQPRACLSWEEDIVIDKL